MVHPPPSLIPGDDIPADNVADDDDDDSDWASVGSSDSDEEIEVEEWEELGLDKEEAKECAYFLKYEETHDVDESIFTPADLEEMKNRERVMMERNNMGYYRCKVKDKNCTMRLWGYTHVSSLRICSCS